MVSVQAKNANVSVKNKVYPDNSYIELDIPEAKFGVSCFVLTYRQAEDLIAAIRKEMK